MKSALPSSGKGAFGASGGLYSEAGPSPRPRSESALEPHGLQHNPCLLRVACPPHGALHCGSLHLLRRKCSTQFSVRDLKAPASSPEHRASYSSGYTIFLVTPPSTTISVPVTNSASTRYSTAFSTSSTLPTRPIKCHS